ncbi:MAG: helix-turn-helix domain-containing protein [Rhodobacteraceae bacterium]|nr:helix-turn-helix domain-containing protein [Paracoccaceae bacterium]
MMEKQPVALVPGWVPEGAQRYLAHTEAGQSIRDLARHAGCHASTVLRQIRRVEMRRDDPLVDAALSALARAHFPPLTQKSDQTLHALVETKDGMDMQSVSRTSANAPDGSHLEEETLRILRRLCETGAVLAVAEEMEKAVVVRDSPEGGTAKTAVVDKSIAEVMALKDWISCANPGRISRYHITSAGRSALGQMLAEAENRARAVKEGGFAEAQAQFSGKTRAFGEKTVPDEGGKPRRVRYNMAESPLTALARRKDKDGQPFLGDDLVRAGERLREDFELAQMGPRVTQNWEGFLTGGVRSGGTGASTDGPTGARDRVARALTDLGPGLSDVALRCCCYLEGLETAEKQMGWSARSGKIVLRIALQRLKRHYEDASGADQLIG